MPNRTPDRKSILTSADLRESHLTASTDVTHIKGVSYLSAPVNCVICRIIASFTIESLFHISLFS
jgi:hypothetical protein